jgi:hypothetical protein
MSESANSSPSFDRSDIVPSVAEITPLYPELSIQSNIEIKRIVEDVWPLLDSRMEESEISIAAQKWNPTQVYYGKQNADRPRAAVEWMLVRSHVTVDTNDENTLRDKLTERDRRANRGLALSQAQRKLQDLTPVQLKKLEIAREVNLKVTDAERRIESEKDKGMGHLLDVLDDLEAYVMDQCIDANIVRLFNAVDDKTGGKNRDLIIARRTIVVMLANELHKNLSR